MLYAFTSCALNYTPKSRALLQSLREHAPDVKVCLALADDAREFDDELLELYDHVFPLSGIPELNRPGWIFKHQIVELATAIKPWVMRQILDLPDCEGVFYFDPDMVLFHDIEDMIANLRDNNIILTPHLTDPETTLRGIEDNELSALKHGAYNLGYIGVRNTDEGKRFARWWANRLKYYCREDIPAGIFTDQKWIDLVPSFFEGVHVLRHPGYNVASWNMTNRHIEKVGPMRYTVNGDRPLVFYHFTGFDSGNHAVMSELYSQGNEDVAELVKWYKDTTDVLAEEPMARVPWAYYNFSDGTKVPLAARRLYRDRKDLQARFPDPFDADPGDGMSYKDWYARHEAELSAQNALAGATVGLPKMSPGGERPAQARRTSPLLRPLLVPARMVKSARYRADVMANLRRTYRFNGVRGLVQLVVGR